MSTRQKSLFKYCKEGNLTKLQHLMDDFEIDLNIRDQWDSTPLYYACLCGHTCVVEYLLQKGSRCMENTFDGERCLYGALTDEIRGLVRNWKQVNQAGLKRDRHYELLTCLLNKYPYSDVRFIVEGKQFNLHKSIMAARSLYFNQSFLTKWRYSTTIVIRNHKLKKSSFSAIIQYIYTGRMDVEHQYLNNVKHLAKNCKLSLLLEEICKSEARVNKLKRLKPFLQDRVQIFSVESKNCKIQLQSDLRSLVDFVIPSSSNDWIDYGILPFTCNDFKPFYSDVCFEVKNHRFFAHKAFLCTYSEYFRARVDDHFSENSFVDEHCVPLIHLNEISLIAFKSIILHAYADAFEINDINSIFEILAYSHMLLIPSLSRRCGQRLAQLLDVSNVIWIFRSAKAYELDRLEDKCIMFMAKNLEKLITCEEFSQLIIEDALNVHDRQETDSIPLVDDIRHLMSEMPKSLSDLESIKKLLQSLETLLSRLGLDC